MAEASEGGEWPPKFTFLKVGNGWGFIRWVMASKIHIFEGG